MCTCILKCICISLVGFLIWKGAMKKKIKYFYKTKSKLSRTKCSLTALLCLGSPPVVFSTPTTKIRWLVIFNHLPIIDETPAPRFWHILILCYDTLPEKKMEVQTWKMSKFIFIWNETTNPVLTSWNQTQEITISIL